MPQVGCLFLSCMPYSYSRLCITTARPTAHDTTNVVIEEAEQELSVRPLCWRLS
jgi:hypothetical protein